MPRAWTLAARPRGTPVPADFALVDLPAMPLGEGEVRVANRWLSVDPYMRGRMNDVKSYVPPFAIGAPMDGGAIGEVTESRDPAFAPGDMVQHMLGWRDEATGPAAAFTKLPGLDVPTQAFLGQFGMPGMTGYWGLLAVAEAKAGDTVFVSAAAGAVGSTVVQIAKARGMTVIGSAGGPAKADWVRSLGADAVIDYKAGPVVRALGEAAASVGKGMIDVYNDAKPTELKYLARLIGNRVQMRGFIVSDYFGRAGEFYRDMAEMKRTLRREETVHDGLEAAPTAFLGLFSGGNTGKMLVRL